MFDTVRTAATAATQNLRQAAKDLGKRPATTTPGDATAAGGAGAEATSRATAYQTDRWIAPVKPLEPAMPAMPVDRGCDGARINHLNAQLERLYTQREQLGDQLAQARIRAQGDATPAAKAEARMAVALLEAHGAAIEMRIGRLEEARTELMDRATWAHNDGPAKLR